MESNQININQSHDNIFAGVKSERGINLIRIS